ncbi:MAG TPA: acyl carrier protein [Caldisericia bacterium]|nr:acyl carrier protein [Caldisericia bacterium]
MLQQIINIFAEILEKNPDEITPNDEFRMYDEWDSLAYLSVIAAIDDKFNIVIPIDDFRKLRTINSLAEYVQSNMEKG